MHGGGKQREGKNRSGSRTWSSLPLDAYPESQTSKLSMIEDDDDNDNDGTTEVQFYDWH